MTVRLSYIGKDLSTCSDKERLIDDNGEKRKAVQEHARIYHYGFKAPSFFDNDFSRSQCHLAAFYEKQNDTGNSHAEDKQGIEKIGDEEERICLIHA